MQEQPSHSISEAQLEAARRVLEVIDPELAGLSRAELARLVIESDPRQAQCDRPGVIRWQDDLIEGLIPPRASVLDLGCGEGELLHRLKRTRAVRGQGVEISADAVFRCIELGVPVIQANLDEGLQGFADQSFDDVILEQTLQTLRSPVQILGEMLRVGRRGVVSFPNFGHWRVRFALAMHGRMPVTDAPPHSWHDSPNIRTLTLEDFTDWAAANRVRVIEGHGRINRRIQPLADAPGRNLHVEEVLLLVESC